MARPATHTVIAPRLYGRSSAVAEIPLASPPFAPRRGTATRGRVEEEKGAQVAAWQFLAIAEIGNFVALRRHLGVARADRALGEVVARFELAFSALRVVPIGRTTVELRGSVTKFDDLKALALSMAALFEAPLNLCGEHHLVALNIGAAGAPVGNTDDVRMFEEAESALDHARNENHPVVRNLAVGAPAFDRRTLTRELSDAIAQGQMFLQYQPKIHVRRQEIASCEALVRWQHPQRGLILPGDFITVAEEAREICALTLWTLDKVIEDQRLMTGDGHPLTVFINISGQLLADNRFVKRACSRVQECGAKIGFEITETAVIRDPQSAIANLKIFADVGITIAIDDYGAGLSSLAYLKQLPARELKIDKMFVLQLTSSNRDPLIVRSTIDLAHALDMEVTAEGVETQAAMALLTVMGCDMVQGYLISRPLSLDAFRHYLATENTSKPDEPVQSFARPASFWKSA